MAIISTILVGTLLARTVGRGSTNPFPNGHPRLAIRADGKATIATYDSSGTMLFDQTVNLSSDSVKAQKVPSQSNDEAWNWANPPGGGGQFITGGCKSDSEIMSGDCGWYSGAMRGRVNGYGGSWVGGE
jgi:hypothetical protein